MVEERSSTASEAQIESNGVECENLPVPGISSEEERVKCLFRLYAYRFSSVAGFVRSGIGPTRGRKANG